MILFLVLIVPFSSALSITGPFIKEPIRFEPNYELDLRYEVSGYGEALKMGAAGELKDYVTYDEIEYQNGGATAIVNAHVRLPESIEKAGLNSLF
ncbi:MAG: hypothetical protein ABIE94_07225, partial [archaeon]